jgi:hypothetical protein
VPDGPQAASGQTLFVSISQLGLLPRLSIGWVLTGVGSLRRVPDEPVPDDAPGLRAANARLRAVVEAKDGQVAVLTAALERERRLELRLAEVERRGITALDAISSAIAGNPWLPPLPAIT